MNVRVISRDLLHFQNLNATAREIEITIYFSFHTKSNGNTLPLLMRIKQNIYNLNVKSFN